MQPTKDFPPKPSYSAAEGGGNNYWVDACGIDDLKADGCGVTKVSLMVRTDSTKAAKDISVRYYFDSSEISNVNSVKPSELYDQAAVEAAPADGVISGPYKYDKKDNTYYIEVKWDGYTIANSGKKYQFTVGMYYGDKWDPTNDPGYKDLKIYEVDDAFFGTGNEVRTDNICVYSGDKLVGGIEPDGSVPEIPTQDPSEDTTTSTPATSSGRATSSAIAANYGDSNCDEVVNLADAVLIMQYKANPSKYTITDQGAVNADVSGDGDGVTNKDALAIQMYLLGLITVLPE